VTASTCSDEEDGPPTPRSAAKAPLHSAAAAADSEGSDAQERREGDVLQRELEGAAERHFAGAGRAVEVEHPQEVIAERREVPNPGRWRDKFMEQEQPIDSHMSALDMKETAFLSVFDRYLQDGD